MVNFLPPNIYFQYSRRTGSNQQIHRNSEDTRGYKLLHHLLHSTTVSGSLGYFPLGFQGIKTLPETQSGLFWNHSATVTYFPEADYVHQGNYSCVYKVAVSSRTFSSPPTELLEVTVKASLAPFIGFGVTAGLLLILVPVIILFIRRHKKQDEMAVKMDKYHGDKNRYETTGEKIYMDDDDGDDPDEDYVNVNADVKNIIFLHIHLLGAKTTCGINNTANEMDDGDYENAEEIAHQRKGSDDFDKIYTDTVTDAEKMHIDDNYEDEEIYIKLD
ncbi:hypothetical protein NFI96_024446 [Prochilodus magdalenae]|nr:hypothetical protein NFI96_024446 [Prochilodus magdalenae]